MLDGWIGKGVETCSRRAFAERCDYEPVHLPGRAVHVRAIGTSRSVRLPGFTSLLSFKRSQDDMYQLDDTRWTLGSTHTE